jgi:hypothetical protein
MAMKQTNADRFKRFKTRYRGVTYRELADGSRRYYVYCRGRQIAVEGGEREALAKQADLRSKVARGEAVAPANVRFADTAEQWFASKHRLRPWTKKLYRMALDRKLLPRFGHVKLAQIDAEAVAHYICELESRGLSASTINNYLLPLSGTFDFARRRGLVSVNPCSLLTADDRPTKREARGVTRRSRP